ncbi:tetratricopeptide repeat protein [Methylovirgula sp. 4M-Z18]|uniref:tetratricopeptide repeat protein n=1 Tax=Methylovirgula sp. 4M-Z18 TaxID=2293567 RepID=UPI000E2E4F07|nr:tetratricopeptide repeat protein [Methylovirgula sp. 4M-Z18]RFB81187.1 hypothetical protein DYH55_07020 [Methylovirgula sp. 4M-Z18]
MNKGIPWSVIGVDFDIREAAKEAARRNGMTLGEWLSGVIADEAEALGVAPHDLARGAQVEALAAQLAELAGGAPTFRTRVPHHSAPSSPSDAPLAAALDRLEKSTRKTGKKAIRALYEVSGRLSAIEEKVGATPNPASDQDGDIQAAFHNLQQELAKRLETSPLEPLPDAPPAGFAETAPEPKDDIRILNEKVDRLAQDLDALRKPLEDLRAPAPEVDHLRQDVANLAHTVATLAPRASVDALDRNLQAMQEQLQDPKRQPVTPGQLGQMQQRIKDLQTLVLSSITRTAAVEKVEQNVQTLGTQMTALQDNKVARANLDGLVRSVDDIQTQLKSLAPKESVEALEQRLSALARKIDETLTPARTDPPSLPAAPELPAKPFKAVPMPQIPDDLLIEPGAGLPLHLQRNAPDHSVLDAARSDAASNRTIQASFIAAARRASQNRQDREDDAMIDVLAEVAHRAGTSDSAHLRRRSPLLLGLGSALVGATALLAHQTPSGAQAGPTTSAEQVQADSQSTAQTTIQVGTYSNSAGDDATAKTTAAPRSSLEQLAAAGNAATEYEMGLRAFDGRDGAQDFKTSAAWFGKAAAQGLAPAQFFLASQYERGEGVEQDLALAQAWYAKSAAQGHIRAMHNLGVMLAKGLGSKSNVAAAAEWFRKAADHGVRDSQFNLGVLYGRGVGVPLDFSQSYIWFALAAAQGDDKAAQMRDRVAARLAPDQLATAKAVVAGFHPLDGDPAANQVTPPEERVGTALNQM